MPPPTSPKGDAALLHASLRAAQASVSVLCALLGSNGPAGQPSASARQALTAAAAAAAALDSISLDSTGEGGFGAAGCANAAGEEEPSASKVERSFVSVADGAAGVQSVLEGLGAGEAVAVHWLAPWVPASVELDGALREGRLNHPALARVMSLDVVASPANRAFAFDQVVALPASRRPGEALELAERGWDMKKFLVPNGGRIASTFISRRFQAGVEIWKQVSLPHAPRCPSALSPARTPRWRGCLARPGG